MAGIDAENIHIDHVGGAKASHPQVDAVLVRLRGGDTLVITRLDRSGRSVLLLMEIVFPWVSEHMPYSDVTI